MTGAEAKARILGLVVTCQREITVGVTMKAALAKLEGELSKLVDEIYDPPGADSGGVVIREMGQPQDNETEAVPLPLDSSISIFHDHINLCHQCRDNPFDLCEEGASLLRQGADTRPYKY